MGDQQHPDDANKSVTRSPARDGAVSELVIGVPAFFAHKRATILACGNGELLGRPSRKRRGHDGQLRSRQPSRPFDRWCNWA